jgi:hypothetical protein
LLRVATHSAKKSNKSHALLKMQVQALQLLWPIQYSENPRLFDVFPLCMFFALARQLIFGLPFLAFRSPDLRGLGVLCKFHELLFQIACRLCISKTA